MNYLKYSNLKEIIFKLLDNKIDKLIVYNEIFRDITIKDFNKFLKALQINKSLNSLTLEPHCPSYFDDFIKNDYDYIIPLLKDDDKLIKPYMSIIKTLNNKNNFKLLQIYFIYNINLLHHILKNNFKYELKIDFRCCQMRSLFLLIDYLKNHKNNIQLELNIFENKYYDNNEIFYKYKYYFNDMHDIHYIDSYKIYDYYSQEELDDIYENGPKYKKLFNNIALQSMDTIINTLKVLVDFLKKHNNIILQIYFNYMFRNKETNKIFENLFYEKYGEDIKNNIVFRNY